MMSNKWTSFTVTGDYNTDIRTLYTALATTAGLEQWFLSKASFYTIPRRTRDAGEFVMKEDTYDWYWYGYSGGDMQKGMILEANGTDLIKFSFSGGSVVSVNLSSRNGISLVELIQDNIPWDDDPDKNLYVQCQLGWTFYLANLKSVIEGGIDLRNKKTEVESNFK